MKTKQQLALMIILLTLFYSVLSCSVSEDPTPVESAWKKIELGATLIDVRTPAEFEKGHLPGAVNIPLQKIEERFIKVERNKDLPLVLYCRSGNRAGKALQILRDNGFTNVTNAGGYQELKHSALAPEGVKDSAS